MCQLYITCIHVFCYCNIINIIFINFWLIATCIIIIPHPEILLKVPEGKTWAWYISPHSISEGAGWNSPSSHNLIYSVCDIQSNTEPENWLSTGFIPLNDAKLLEIKIGYSLRNCPDDSTIKNCKTYLDIYALHTNKKLLTDDSDPGLVRYEFVDRITPGVKLKPNELKEFTYHGKFITKAKGVYLAFKDQGVCIVLQNFTLGYKFCSEKGKDLVTFPRTVAPANDSQVEEKDGKCSDSHSVSKGKLSGVCLSSGEWNITDGVKCLCMKGYELVETEPNSLGCRECPKGSYKNTANNEKCVRCPANSSSDTARTGCICNEGFYKLADVERCATLPRAPLTANTTVVKATYVTINWTRSPDDNDTGILRYSVDCFRCMPPTEKECKESCGPSVKYRPSKDNITDVWVTVHGLQSDSIFQFRVYSVSELNQQEKDRDKWKYVTIRVRTKEQMVTPTKPQGRGPLSSEIKLALYIGAPIVLILLIAVCVFVVCICRSRSRKGYSSPVELKDGQVILPSHGQRLYIDPSNYEDPEEALKDFAKELDKKWIKLEHIIGGGEFGDVFKGLLTRPEEETIHVAVKTLKTGAAPKNRKDFISEASIMGQFCDPNVIFLEGVVTKTLPLMIVIEFMSNGSLDNFLKKMDGNLTVQQLLGMARGVASGMKYLSEMNFVHRDLAARNVLVSEGMVCKVADFGLSRELEDSAYETKGGKIPVRWTALEAIEYRKFAPSSDVWSYGVVLWEIMSFGERPYWDWSNYEVMDRVKAGYRLPPPLECPKAIHQIMLNCWHADRNKRPKFADVVKKLDVLIRSPDKLNEVSSPESPKSPKLEYTEVTPIHDWLNNIKMGQYTDVFSRAGFRNLKEVTQEDELDLTGMGIKLIGHKNKIRKSLREVKKTLIKDTAF